MRSQTNMKFKMVIICLTLTIWGRPASPQAVDPVTKLKCAGPRLEINYWTIRDIEKDRVHLDFSSSLSFPCESYREKVYAFSENGEIVPLTFKKVIVPKMMYRGDSKEESTTCLCSAQEDKSSGFCGELYGTETTGLDISKTKCRYIGQYTFDPKFKLQAKTVAIHIEDIKSAKYENFKMIPLKANTPEGKAFMQKKFFYPPYREDDDKRVVYQMFLPSKVACPSDDCSKFGYNFLGDSPLYISDSKPNEALAVIPFANCYLVGAQILCNDKNVCSMEGHIQDFRSFEHQIQGKLTLENGARELFIVYYQYSDLLMQHALFDQKLNALGGAIAYESICGNDQRWLNAMERAKQKATATATPAQTAPPAPGPKH